MTEPLILARAARASAKATFDGDLAQVKTDLAARGIGGRIADQAGAALHEAGEIAGEHKGVIAGTIAALVAWFLRAPIARFASHAWDEIETTIERKVKR